MIPLATSGCLLRRGGQGPEAAPPEAAAQALDTEAQPSVEEIKNAAEIHYWMGVEAQADTDEERAQEHFDDAIAVFMEADIPEGQEAEFRLAFNELVNRVHAQQVDNFQVTIEAEAPELPQEEIPPLSDAEIELLRARLADTLPELPRFTVPIPMDNPRLIEALEYLTTRRRDVIEEGLSRATRFMPLIAQVFAEEGVPAELAWIPLIESLFKPYVRSRSSAVGLWQLMAPTARLYGLRVDYYVDERRDPVKSTRAIARFILDYYREFDDWHLMIGAYNGGKGRIARALRRSGTDNFWSVSATSRYLPRETREFVPKILSAILIGTDPEQYDFHIEQQPPFVFDEVEIDSMTDLQVVAEAAGTTLDVIQDLNPHLLRRTTPRADAFTIRVPPGRAGDFRTAFAAIPVDERVRVAEHVVRRGETLSQIGSAYGLSWRAIADYNGISNVRRIRAGQRLLIPIGESSGRAVAAASPQGSGYDRGERLVHTVRRGESLSRIATAYRTSISAIKRWNGLASDRIYVGDRLEILYGERTATSTTPTPAAVAAAPTPAPDDADDDPIVERFGGAVVEDLGSSDREVVHTVRRGDTLTSISRQYGVGITDIRSWNAMRSDRIFPGDKLKVRTDGSTPTRYTVRRGDTLTSIAQRFGTTIAQLCDWNGITPRKTLFPGNTLVIGSRTGR